MLAATGLLEETMLPLLWYWLISRVNKVLMLCTFLAMTSHLFFHVKWNLKSSMELARSCCRPKQHPLLHSIFLSFIRLWVKIWHRNKTTCSILNPVPSSRSKSTGMTCPRKGDCSDLNWTAQLLQMVACKSLETMSCVILNQLQPRFSAKLVPNKMWCLKAM